MASGGVEGCGWRPRGCDQIALVLQGGGALGAYQAGVFEALHEAGVEPDWVSGVSIGAINSSIIAGNPPERRVQRLRAFWERITDRKIWFHTPDGDVFRKMRNTYSAYLTHSLGQPGFFSPRQVNPWLSFAGAKDALSYYDTQPLRETLLELVDFDLINSRRTRFSVGAVNVRTGNFLYFDNHDMIVGPEHVMASGALPPAFPMVQIGTDYFWDGGIVSNTPLQHILEYDTENNTMIFQVDLFSSRGALPRDIQDVMSRQKDITYASRTRYNTDVYRLLRKWKTRAYHALMKVPDDKLTEDDRKLRDRLGKLP
ncbi:MAG: patatin-like phospholipase family protein, partial [Methylocystis sp.]